MPEGLIWIKDSLDDRGDEPNLLGDLARSPDIIARQTELTDFGPLLVEDPAPACDPVRRGRSNWVYLRVRKADPNGGTINPVGTASVWYSRSATLAVAWTKVGEVNFLPIVDTVRILPIEWLAGALPPVGHYCFVALLNAVGDAGPTDPNGLPLTGFADWIREKNNRAWRNFEVIEAAALKRRRLPFGMPGDPKRKLNFAFEIHSRLQENFSVTLSVPTEFAKLFPALEKVAGTAKTTTLKINPLGVTRLGTATWPAGVQVPANLYVTFPEKLAWTEKKRPEIWVRQLYDEKEIGRMTWSFSLAQQQRR